MLVGTDWDKHSHCGIWTVGPMHMIHFLCIFLYFFRLKFRVSEFNYVGVL